MARYELLLLAIPELTKDETRTLEATIEQTVTAHNGTLLSWDRWGKYRLEYTIGKNDYGIYFLSRFDVDTAHAAALLEALRVVCSVKFVDIVIRHMITRLAPQASLEYKRPESLEETPSRDGAPFFKDSPLEEIIRPEMDAAPEEQHI